LIALLAFSACCAAQVSASPVKDPSTASALELRLAKVETRLEDQTEAGDRQGEAFDAAVDRVEIVNAALVAVIALAGLAGGILAVKWVRQTAQEQISTQVEKAGEKVFEAEASALRDQYEEKFADLYRRYKRLTDQS